jgi:hypothetical protein
MSTTKFSASMYVTAYRLAVEGLADERIGEQLGVTGITFRRWCRAKPYLAEAVAEGRKTRNGTDERTYQEYIYGQLPPELQDVWDQINEWTNLRNGRERIDALLARHGKYARQQLFVHALATSMFNLTQSLRQLGLSRKTYEGWRANDPRFAELIDEIEWHKDNYLERSLLRLVKGGSEPAILHCAKTRLRKRGYNEKTEIEISGGVGVNLEVSIADLELPLDVRRQVLDALRKRQGALAAATTGEMN